MKNRVIKFLVIYIVFLLFVLVVNLTLEIITPTPERAAVIAECGWECFLKEKIKGVVIFYVIFNFIGSVIFLLKNYKWKKMGQLSFIIGFILEFLLMRPDWVQNIFSFNITFSVITAVIISSLYWFGAWGAPAYLLHKFILKK